MLYDNQETEVALKDEMQFLENYISLMRIRLPQHVEVRFTQDIANPDKKVAPLILISLVENAFKHGVSPTEHSFIHIDVVQQASSLTVKIENSNHPKTERDRSGHGIGLQQVQKRLDLSYPGRYQWEKGVSGATYYSHIAISL
jgi:LytS/YehU family sensor histidine kinase